MLVLGRFYFDKLKKNKFLPSSGLFECLVGLTRESGGFSDGSPNAAAAAIRLVVEQFCVRRQGKRINRGTASGPGDEVDNELLNHFKAVFYF